MVYISYPTRAQIGELGPWYAVRALHHVVRAGRAINFSIVEQRQQMLERLGNLPTVEPFDRDTRFSDGLYVSETAGDWGRKFMQLRTALQYKDHAKDAKFRPSAIGGTPDAVAGSADFGDSLVAYQNALTAMYDQMSRIDGVFDTDSAELHFRMVWQD